MKVLKPVAFLLCLGPVSWLIWAIFNDALSANPIDDITDLTGRWTLRFLLITLSVSPIRHLTGWNRAIRFRLMFGLFAFFYGLLHFTTYLALDRGFRFSEIGTDIGKRPYITVGFTGFVLMLPLAMTSTKKWIGRLGGRRWQLLHRAIYVSAIAGVIHYLWLVKLDIKYPIRYGVLLSVLLGFRLWDAIRRRRRNAAALPLVTGSGSKI